jgi:S-DNA-T family DNA segregation ATPase FtsK/SpoIIIE
MKIEAPDFEKAIEIYSDDLKDGWRDRSVLPIGFDSKGRPHYQNFSQSPILLMAGVTGSGKSNTLHNFICSSIIRFTPQELKLVLIDCKQVEFNNYKDIPHLFSSVKYCSTEDIHIFDKLVGEIDSRRDSKTKKPFIFIVIDEFSDLSCQYPSELEKLVEKISKFGSTTGMGLAMHTSRPSIDVITTNIKSSAHSILGFATGSEIDSKTLIGKSGCEKLLGEGDGLFLPENSQEPIHIQVPLITDQQIKKIVQKSSVLSEDI